MSPIQQFKLTYDPVKKDNTVHAGDTLTGAVTFTLTEETKVKSLEVKAKGEADVHWGESHGYGTHVHYRSYDDHKDFYKVKEFLIAKKDDETVLPQGDYRYEFKLTIPEGNMPPSFKGSYGQIMHQLKAKLRRSWHTSTKDKKDLNFVSKPFLQAEQCPQTGSVEKDVGLFSKSKVQLTATVDKRICSPGDTIQISAKVTNKLSEKLKLKARIDKKIVNRASHKAKIEDENVCKVVGESIDSGFEGEMSCSITVPTDTKVSILNCDIINVEFYLKVYLDICLDTDPEVVFPLVIALPEATA